MFVLTTILEIVGRVFNFAQTVRTTVSNLDAFRRLDAPFAPNARARARLENTGRGLFLVLVRKQSFVWAHGPMGAGVKSSS